jgi:hypothetical protein
MLGVVIAAIGLPLLFALELHWGTSTVDLRQYGSIDLPLAPTLVLYALAIAQGALLAWIYWNWRRRPTGARGYIALLACSAAVMLGIALVYPVTTTADPLAYLGYAKLPHFRDAYAPPHFDFGPGFEQITGFWGNPMVACVYGPLWLALDRLVLGHAHSIPGAVFTLRIENLIAYGVLLGALAVAGIEPDRGARRRQSRPDRIVRPERAQRSRRAGPHRPRLRRGPSAPALARGRVRRGGGRGEDRLRARRARRVLRAAAALTATVPRRGDVGPRRLRLPYLRAMSGVGGRIYESTLSHHLYALGLAVHAVSAAIAIAAIAAGLWFRRALAGAAWSFWTLSAAYFEWYVAWCLPYALRARPSAYVFLCAWPFAAMLIWHPIQHVYPMALVPVLVFGELALRRRRRLLRQAPA